MDQFSISPPYILAVNLDDQARVDQPISCFVRAAWPNPAWKMESTAVEWDAEKLMVELICLGKKRTGGMTVMVIKEFSFQSELKFPKVGEWTVTVRGRDKSFTTKLVVT